MICIRWFAALIGCKSTTIEFRISGYFVRSLLILFLNLIPGTPFPGNDYNLYHKFKNYGRKCKRRKDYRSAV